MFHWSPVLVMGFPSRSSPSSTCGRSCASSVKDVSPQCGLTQMRTFVIDLLPSPERPRPSTPLTPASPHTQYKNRKLRQQTKNRWIVQRLEDDFQSIPKEQMRTKKCLKGASPLVLPPFATQTTNPNRLKWEQNCLPTCTPPYPPYPPHSFCVFHSSIECLTHDCLIA